MSERPVFEPNVDGSKLVEKHSIEFTWFPGFAKEQKQKSKENDCRSCCEEVVWTEQLITQKYKKQKIKTKNKNKNFFC